MYEKYTIFNVSNGRMDLTDRIAKQDLFSLSINWKGYRRKQSWPHFRFYPDISLEMLKRTRYIPQSG
jgi:hypothetical protein